MKIHKISLKDNDEQQITSCFLGISINKPLDIEFFREQISYVENSYDYIVVLIADTIDIINQMHIEYKNYDEALKNVRAKFFLWKTFLEKRIKEIAKLKKDTIIGYEGVKAKFHFVGWEDISHTSRFQLLYNKLIELYQQDGKFRDEVWTILRNYLKARNKSNIISEKLLEGLSEYILNELITLIDGIDIGDSHYDCIVYPTFKETLGGMNILAEKLYHKLDSEFSLRGRLLIESSLNGKE